MGDTPSASGDLAGFSAGLNLSDLRAFVEVAQTGSFRLAAVNLFTSQPSVSRAVARLEAELGVRLFDRGPRGALVTARGAVLLDGSRRLLAAATTLRRDVTELGYSTVKLGATATSARAILARFLSAWMPEHPDINVTAVEDSEAQLKSRLVAGDCDAAIVSGPIDSRQLESLKITTVRVIALFPPDHPRGAAPGSVDVLDLASEPLLVNGAAFPATDLLLKEFRRLDAEPNIVYESSAGQTLAAMAEVGLGVAVFGDAADLRGFTMIPQQVTGAGGRPLAYDLYIAWSHEAAPPWLREFAIELTTSFRSWGPSRQLDHG